MAPLDANYTKGDIKRAGDFLRDESSTINIEDYNQAHEALSYWRASHVVPMQAMLKSIRDKAFEIDRDAIIVQRLKRAPSIISKLKRENGMRLDRMEDIVGCRVVVTNMQMVYALYKMLKKWRTKHSLHRERDYIINVKDSGYRGIHIIFKYNGKDSKFHGRPIELQLRSRVQHSWATAVEVVDIFTKQTLKASVGEEDWLLFFKLVSIAFSDMENGKLSENSNSVDRQQLRQITSDLSVIEKLKAFVVSTKHLGTNKKNTSDYYLLRLNIESSNIEFIKFEKKQLDEANKLYAQLEKKYGDDNKQDVVLVAALSIEGLKKAYPNYFADTDIFTTNLKLVLNAKVKPNKTLERNTLP